MLKEKMIQKDKIIIKMYLKYNKLLVSKSNIAHLKRSILTQKLLLQTEDISLLIQVKTSSISQEQVPLP